MEKKCRLELNIDNILKLVDEPVNALENMFLNIARELNFDLDMVEDMLHEARRRAIILASKTREETLRQVNDLDDDEKARFGKIVFESAYNILYKLELALMIESLSAIKRAQDNLDKYDIVEITYVDDNEETED